MNKKIYALKTGGKPGIYEDWLTFFDEIKDKKNIESKSFVYSDDKSYKKAKQDAQDYLNEDKNNPFTKFESLEEAEAKIDEALRDMLKLDKKNTYGTVWLDLVIKMIGAEEPILTNGRYVGSYFPTSIYTFILYMVLNYEFTEKMIGVQQSIKNQMEIESIRYEWTSSLEYEELSKRLKRNGLQAVDINEVRYRNLEYARNTSLIANSESYKAMKHFIKAGNHTLVDLYDELMTNEVYRRELVDVSGPYHNPELDVYKSELGNADSLQKLMLQSSELGMALRNELVGQDAAIEKLEKAFFHKNKQGLKNVYLFTGAPGVGKTFSAEIMAKTLGINYKRFDMSGYGSINALDEVCGISTLFKGAKPGTLTSYVDDHPHSILLFDEIEKAHKSVIMIFLQILDEGKCFDRYLDKNVSFKDCTIIFTTNAGKNLYQHNFKDNLTNLPDNVIIDALEKDINPETKAPYFPPELVSRLASHTIIMFNNLKSEAIFEIIENDVKRQKDYTLKQYGVDISEGLELLTATAMYSVGGSCDARNASKLASKIIDKEIYNLLEETEKKHGTGPDYRINKIVWKCDLDGASKEVRELYKTKKSLRQQALTFDTRAELDCDNCSATIVFCNLKLESAISAEDKEIIVSDDIRPTLRWKDVYVSKDVKEELRYFINYLKNYGEYAKTKSRLPKGALMYGPPGTGKTSLAKVVAAESKVSFISVGADELLSGGSAKVHSIFAVARKYAPAVLFIDEIDAIGTSRNTTGTNATLNALLTEMDGFAERRDEPVFVMGATNIRAIDGALARRFDRSFYVDVPDEKGRRWLFKKFLSKYRRYISISDNELSSVVDRSVGLSPAEIENIVEAALRESIRRSKQSIYTLQDADFDEIFEKCNFGGERKHDTQEDLRHTAYHEAGHAFVSLYYGNNPKYLSVIARGEHGGYVLSEQLGEHPTKEKLLHLICTKLAGRAAEEEFGYGITTGAGSDIKSATELATAMVCRYGMFYKERGLAFISEDELRYDADAKALINSILEEQLDKAREIIGSNKKAVEQLVEAVLGSSQKCLTEKELVNIYNESRKDV